MKTERIALGVAALLALTPPLAGAQAPAGATADVAILSGGIGETSATEMKQAAKNYNVHLVFSNRRGEYVADVPYTVVDARRREVAAGTSEGPLLYLRLPPGRYEVSARIGSTALTKRIHAASGGRAADIHLIGDES